MKQNIIKFLLIAFLVGFYSCEKDYLTLENPNALSADVFWSSLEDTDKGLTAMYSALMDHYILMLDKEGMRTDEGWPGWGRPGGNSKVGMWYLQTYSSSHNELEYKWNGCYEVIFRANQVIEGLEGIQEEMETEEDQLIWQHQMAQARFFRGMMHFYLHSTFNKGEIIIRDYVPETLEDFNTSVSSSDEVIAFFREDLNYAYSNLPAQYLYADENSVAAQNVGRATKGAAATILGTSYLYEATEGAGPNDMVLIDSATKYFADVILNPEYGYRLLSGSETSDLFTLAGEFNSESILEICYNLEFNTALNQWNENSLHNRWTKMMRGSEGPLLPAWVIYAYKTEAMDPLDSRNKINDSTLRNVSLRCSQYITVVEDVHTMLEGRGNVTDKELFAWDGWGFGRCSKYGMVHEDAPLENDWQSNKNVVLNRLAGVYLMLAECMIYQNRIDDALDLINAVRGRWGLVLLGDGAGDLSRTYDGYNYAGNVDSLMNRLMYHESPLELLHEGHARRWIDLRRWGVTQERFTQLAAQTYYAVGYTGTNAEGGAVTKGYASIVRASDSTYVDDHKVVDYEYDLTAINYDPDIHDWFAIPMTEASANSEVE